MNNAAKPPSADELLLPRLSDDDAVEIQRFIDHLFEARDGDQINRLHDSLPRDKLVGYDGDPQPGDPPFWSDVHNGMFMLAPNINTPARWSAWRLPI